MQADPRIMRLNLKKIQEGIDIKTTSLKSVKKKLRMVTKENETKQAELQELKKRYAETLLKLQIGTDEAQLLSKEVEELKGTTGDATVNKLQNVAHNIIKQYVEEVRDEVLARKYKVFKGDVYDKVEFDENDEGDTDEDDVPVSARDTDVPHLEEKKSAGGGVTGSGKSDVDAMVLRRGLGDDDEKEGAHLPFDHEELESKNSDDEGENPQGDAKKPDILAQFDRSNTNQQKLEDEIHGGTKWLQKRHKKQIKHFQDLVQIQGREVVVLYTEPDGIGGESVYQCVIRVQDGATFHDIIDESCAHWGLMPEYTFLEDNVSGAIWPGNAIVEKEIPLDKIRPELHLTFVQNLKLNELVVLSKKDQERKERIKLMQDQSKGDSMFENDPSSATKDGKSEEEKDGGKSSESSTEFTKGGFVTNDAGESVLIKEMFMDPDDLPGGMNNVRICYLHFAHML